nr:MAG TPA: transmembrane protein [Caudoviricetes sp.]
MNSSPKYLYITSPLYIALFYSYVSLKVKKNKRGRWVSPSPFIYNRNFLKV